MPKEIKPICRNCALAVWQRTDGGRIRSQVPGHCSWKPPEIVYPIRVNKSVFTLPSIWRDEDEDCPAFEMPRNEIDA